MSEKTKPKFDGKITLYKLEDDFGLMFKRDKFSIPNQDEFLCLSFLSSGCLKYGQKELLLVLKYNFKTEKMMDANGNLIFSNKYVAQVGQIFSLIFEQAKKGNFIGTQGYTELSTRNPGEDFLGGFKGLLYSISLYFPKGYTPLPYDNDKYLVCTLVNNRELDVYKFFGSSRILSNLGKREGWFPTPFWNDLYRADSKMYNMEIFKKTMGYFVFAGTKQVVFDESTVRVEKDKDIILSLHKRNKKNVKEFISKLDLNEAAILFRTTFDEKSDSHLYYDTKAQKGQITAISNYEKKNEKCGGTFVSFGQKEGGQSFSFLEDGFVILMDEKNYVKFFEKIKKGEDHEVVLNSKHTLKLVWKKSEEKEEPEKEQKSVIVLKEIHLVTPDEDFTKRGISPQILSDFVEKNSKIVLDFVKKNHAPTTKKELFEIWFGMKIPKDSKEVKFKIEKITDEKEKKLSEEILQFLENNVSNFEKCNEKGKEINLTLTFSLIK